MFTLATLSLIVGASALTVPRSFCSFGLTASGGESGTIGQLSDGQNRIGGGLSPATFIISGGGITDAASRGCILTPSVDQFQCDQGANPTYGFAIESNGTLTSSGSSIFYACPASDTEWNLYTTPVAGQEKCVEITLTASGCGAEATTSAVQDVTTVTVYGCSSTAPAVVFSSMSSPQGVVATPAPIDSATETIVPVESTSEVVVPQSETTPIVATTSPTTPEVTTSEVVVPASETAPAVVESTTPTPPEATISEVVAPQPETTTSPAVPEATTSEAVVPSPETTPVVVATPSTTPEVFESLSTPIEVSTPATVIGGLSTSLMAVSSVATLTTSYHPHSMISPSSVIETSTTSIIVSEATSVESETPMMSSTVITPVAPATSKVYQTTAPYANTTVKAFSTASSTSSSSTCVATTLTGTDTSGNYQYPHLIIPISSTSPNTAYGTQYFGTISSNVSTIFNFDIPSTYSGKTCNLIFLLPLQSELETSSYTYSGTGEIEFEQLSSAATSATTYDNAPSVETDLGEFDITEGSSTLIESFECTVGRTVTYELKAVGDTDLYYFQDWNPSPIGLFITYC